MYIYIYTQYKITNVKVCIYMYHSICTCICVYSISPYCFRAIFFMQILFHLSLASSSCLLTYNVNVGLSYRGLILCYRIYSCPTLSVKADIIFGGCVLLLGVFCHILLQFTITCHILWYPVTCSRLWCIVVYGIASYH